MVGRVFLSVCVCVTSQDEQINKTLRAQLSSSTGNRTNTQTSLERLEGPGG